jgi:hypothetical protein
MVGVPLCGVVDLSWCRQLWGFCGVLIHFFLGLQENGAVFGAMVYVTARLCTGLDHDRSLNTLVRPFGCID